MGVDGRGRGSKRTLRRGVLAAGALCFCLAAATAFRIPVFFGHDEPLHFSYAVEVVQGDLPRIDDPLPTSDDQFPVLARWRGYDEVPIWDTKTENGIFVANHPPLFYLLASGPLRLASGADDDVVAPLTLRLLNAAFMSLGVVLTGWLAVELFPRARHRALLGVVAAGLAAATPNLVGVAAYGHNDGLGFALWIAALLVALRLLRRGPDELLLAWAALVGCACALTRVSLLPAVAAMVVAAVAGAWRHRPRGGRLPWAAGGLLAVGALPAVASAWFYLRNQDLYGSMTGDDYNLRRLGWLNEGTATDVLQRSAFHERLWGGLYGSVHPRITLADTIVVVAVLVAVVLVGLVVRLWCGAPKHLRHGDPVNPVDPAGIGWLAWGLVVVANGAVVVGAASHVAHGGSPHSRYLLPLVPLVSAVVARAIEVLPSRRLAGAVVVSALSGITAGLLLRYGDLIAEREAKDVVALPGAPASSWLTWSAAALAAVAFAGMVLAVLDQRRAAPVQHRVDDFSPLDDLAPAEAQVLQAATADSVGAAR